MTVSIAFRKMHGAANDFVVIDHRAPFLPTGPELAEWVARWCDRRCGIGADGVLLLERDPELDFAMRYYNSDGGAAEYCGNGARCLARLALDLGLGREGVVRFRTAAGIQDARRLADGRVEVHLGHLDAAGDLRVIEAAGLSFSGRWVEAGVPHFVCGIARMEEVRLADWAPALRHHPAFGAAGANVDFVARESDGLAMRTWERGVEGETLACGSGAIASALWAAADGASSPIAIHTAGGDVLEVRFVAEEQGWDVSLAGPVEVPFTGSWQELADMGIGPRGGDAACSKV